MHPSDIVYLTPGGPWLMAASDVMDTPEAACGAQPQGSIELARSALMA